MFAQGRRYVAAMQTPLSVGEVAARNLRELRARRRLSVRELSKRLGELGYPLLPSGVSNIEAGEGSRRRRVVVDDLPALALALRTTPAGLLSPHGDPREPIAVTPGSTMKAWDVAEWVRGEGLPWGHLQPGDEALVLDLAPEHVQRQRRLDAARQPAREAVKRVGRLVDAAVEDYNPGADYAGVSAEDRQPVLAERLRAEADALRDHLRLLADDLERAELERTGGEGGA